jgi:hypothetical protein
MTVRVAEKPRLDYAPAVPWRRTRSARLLLVLLLLAIGAGGAVLVYPRAKVHLQVLEWQRRCMAAPVPPGTVVLEDRDGFYQSGQGVPFVWRSLYGAMSPPGLNSASTVFLQEMRTPAGRRRLVAVDIDRAPGIRPFRGPYVLNLTARVVSPGVGLLRPSVASTTSHSLNVSDSSPRHYDSGRPLGLRLQAGTRDPQDPSHFTFTYEAGGLTHVVDGWLREDDTVNIEPRAGGLPTPPAPASPASLPTLGGSGIRPSAPPAAR